MIRLKFEIEFLTEHEVLARYQGTRFFSGVFAAYARKDVFIRITDSRFGDVGDEFYNYLRVVRDFRWYKLFHLSEMSGYRLGRVMLWDKYNSSIIISIHRDW